MNRGAAAPCLDFTAATLAIPEDTGELQAVSNGNHIEFRENPPKSVPENLENIMSTIQKALVEAQLEKLEMLKVQEQWEAYKAREESRGLARISQVLISIWQLPGIILKLAEGQSLVIDKEGNMWKGRTKTEKLQHLPQKLAVKKSRHVLDVGTFQSMKTSSSVSSPGPAWKNQWDKIRSKLVKSPTGEFLPVEISIFLFDVDEISPDEVTYGENVAGNGDWKFTEVTWNKYPKYTMGIVQATGTLKYWKKDGEIHWID